MQMDAGSVDEHSTKSDEEYDDLAMRDGTENGYWTDDEQNLNSTKTSPSLDSILAQADDAMEQKYQQNMDLFLKMTKEAAEMPCAYILLDSNNNSNDAKIRKWSVGEPLWL